MSWASTSSATIGGQIPVTDKTINMDAINNTPDLLIRNPIIVTTTETYFEVDCEVKVHLVTDDKTGWYRLVTKLPIPTKHYFMSKYLTN